MLQAEILQHEPIQCCSGLLQHNILHTLRCVCLTLQTLCPTLPVKDFMTDQLPDIQSKQPTPLPNHLTAHLYVQPACNTASLLHSGLTLTDS